MKPKLLKNLYNGKQKRKLLSGKSKLVTNYNGESQIFEKNYYCERKVKNCLVGGGKEERNTANRRVKNYGKEIRQKMKN